MMCSRVRLFRAAPDAYAVAPRFRVSKGRLMPLWRHVLFRTRRMKHEQKCPDGDRPYRNDPGNHRAADQITV